MTKVLYIISFLFIAHFNSFAQTSINDYKYIIVPNQYDFLKEKDQYQINSLTKFLFNKYGYEAYMQDENFPDDLRNNRCLGLLADVVKDNGLFKTKLQIDLKDCNGNVVYSSKMGETREKEYSKAYNLALRDAFTTYQNLDYSYQPNEAILAKGISSTSIATKSEQEEIERLKKELNALKEAKKTTIEVEPSIANEKVVENKTEPKINEKVVSQPMIEASEVLYAQSIEKGFQLVDNTPKVVMILYSTAAKDVFTVKNKNAIVFKKGDQWIYSENNGEIVNETILNIKF